MNKLNTITFFLSILVGLFFIGPVITTAEENYFIAPKNVSQPAVRVIKGLLRVIQHKSVDDPGLFISEALRTQIMEPFQYDGFGLTGLAVDRDIDIDSAAGHKGVGGVILLIDVNSRTATFSFDAEYRTQGGNLTVLSAILRDKVLQPPAAVAVFTPADSVDAAPYAKAGDYSGLIAALTQNNVKLESPKQVPKGKNAYDIFVLVMARTHPDAIFDLRQGGSKEGLDGVSLGTAHYNFNGWQVLRTEMVLDLSAKTGTFIKVLHAPGRYRTDTIRKARPIALFPTTLSGK